MSDEYESEVAELRAQRDALVAAIRIHDDNPEPGCYFINETVGYHIQGKGMAEQLKEALATIERIRNLKPTWHRGMYGSPDDMFSAISIHRALETPNDPR